MRTEAEALRNLAAAVILQAILDLGNDDVTVRREAWGFVHGIGDANEAMRSHWVQQSGTGDGMIERLDSIRFEKVKAARLELAGRRKGLGEWFRALGMSYFAGENGGDFWGESETQNDG